MASTFTVSLAIFMVLFGVASCLKCYHCRSDENTNCSDPFKANDTSMLMECGSAESINFKLTATASTSSGLPSIALSGPLNSKNVCHKIIMKDNVTFRLCLETDASINKTINELCERMINETKVELDNKKIGGCYACDKDKCNNAGFISFSLPLLVITLSITHLLSKE